MFKNLWNSKLFQILVSATLSVLLVFLSQGLKNGHDDAVVLKAEFDKRPTSEQVNRKFEEQRLYIDTQDEHNMDALRQHIEESNRTAKAQVDLFKSMDRKLNILINRDK